ncbi:acyltransferase [Telmatobacter sp. DSM 110680]|uniref:Acyltransferase n=1 Tax=Telmatobacter sp. DSM 110680 TaxID=3036704 RepID=A0AAU7DS72_9BACT
MDAVRFLAFFLVFLSHTLPSQPNARLDSLLHGFAPLYYGCAEASIFGLSLFFTLSAFLICELLLRERSSTGTIEVKQFYFRRILRIWPLYYLGLALGALIAVLPGGNRGDLVEISWYVIFMGAWQCAAHGGLDNPMAVLWSISVEEQFYLFAPWILKYFNRRTLFAICAALILVSNGRLYYLSMRGVNGGRTWVDPLVQFQCFAAGILLCLVLRSRLPRLAIWSRILILVLSGMCWFFANSGPNSKVGPPYTHSTIWHILGGYTLASLGSVLALIAFLGLDAHLIPRAIVYLGRISFGLYVFHGFAHRLVFGTFPYAFVHEPPMFLGRIFASFALTVLMAALSYRYFELWFLQMKVRRSVIPSRPLMH